MHHLAARSSYVVGLLFILLVNGFIVQAKEKGGPQTPWSTEELLELLMRQQAVTLDIVSSEKGCKSALISAWSDKNEVTLGKYLAYLIATLDSSFGQSGVSSNCKAEGKDDGFKCDVMLSTGLGTESPWSYGVRFKINKTGEIDPASLMCPGGS